MYFYKCEKLDIYPCGNGFSTQLSAISPKETGFINRYMLKILIILQLKYCFNVISYNDICY